MTRHLVHSVVFLAGLAVVCWIGAGYLGSNPLALAVTGLIALFYLAGALELLRYRQGTATLTRALAGLSEAPASLGQWLGQLHPGLRNAARLRIEGERAALPGPALAPYLAGLLVLLGMLGTFLGMVATLRGTGLALESAVDLQAIRASLAAPVKGLGFAFGTSVAGVASSAALGLLAALCRRERLEAAQALDASIATTLRIYSQSHQREESFKLLQRQAEAMPALVDRLQAMMAALERQTQAMNERLAAGQDDFHGKTEAAYTRLAASVEQSLKQSAADSARAAGAAIQPAVEAALAGLASQSAALQDQVANAVQRHLDGLAGRFEATTATVGDIWSRALDGQQQANATLNTKLDAALQRFAATFEQRSASLLDGVAGRLDTAASQAAGAWSAALAEQERVNAKLDAALQRHADAFEQRSAGLLDGMAERLDAAAANAASAWSGALAGQERVNDKLAASLQHYADTFEQRSAGLLDGVSARLDAAAGQAAGAWTSALAEQERASEKLADSLQCFTDTFEQRSASLIDGVSARLDAAAGQAAGAWTSALAEQQRVNGKLADDSQRALTAAAAAFEQHSAGLLRALGQSHAELQAQLVSQDQQRLAAWNDSLGAIAATLRQEWEQAGAHASSRQQEICDALARAAHDISSQTGAQARDTIAEIARLVQAASEAPKAAAEVIGELRQKLSEGMERDNAMLEERSRLLETLGTLLDAVNHAATEQRTAVDALVSSSAELLDRVGSQFVAKVEDETGKLGSVAAQVTGSAAEVASLGEAFGAAVQLFSQSNDKLVDHLQRIETALDKSMTRSDEQLAYYVAQAREVVDLSLMSQKQIVEDLQQLAAQRAPAGSETA
ncbi:DUF802 domain-containing protein [Bordetella petrii]|uniref:DUF802 domain-containing protein n=1 Tax=Bordetella petrii TaxID=94624 RepID=UPI00372EB95E